MKLSMLRTSIILHGNLYSTLEGCNQIHCTLNNINRLWLCSLTLHIYLTHSNNMGTTLSFN